MDLTEQIIQVENLERYFITKRGIFKRKTEKLPALKGITFHVNKGELFSFLGPNGAGKTTTIRILTGLLNPSSGKAYLMGKDIVSHYKEVQQAINFIYGGERALYWRLTALDNLKYFSDLLKIPYQKQLNKIQYVLELVGLQDKQNKRVETYSKGMRQRLQIARALLNDPEILFLDEPTIGLDPGGARDFKKIIKNLKAENKTIFLTTHYMPEADELSDRIAIINDGLLIDIDSPHQMKAKYCDFKLVEFDSNDIQENDIAYFKSFPEVLEINTRDIELWTRIEIKTNNPHQLIEKIARANVNFQIRNLHYREGTLEDAYINLII